MVNSSRFASDPRIDKPWGSTLREKLPRSVRLRYVNWRSKERQQQPVEGSHVLLVQTIHVLVERLGRCEVLMHKDGNQGNLVHHRNSWRRQRGAVGEEACCFPGPCIWRNSWTITGWAGAESGNERGGGAKDEPEQRLISPAGYSQPSERAK